MYGRHSLVTIIISMNFIVLSDNQAANKGNCNSTTEERYVSHKLGKVGDESLNQHIESLRLLPLLPL